MVENISPEEKLFKIIQKGKGSDSSATKKSGTDWIGAARRAFIIWKERLISGITGSAGKAKPVFPWKLREIKLRTVNAVLAVLLALFILFGVYYAVAKYPNAARIAGASVKTQRSMVSADRVVEELHPLSFYTEDAKERDIFNAAESAATVTPAQAATTAVKGQSGDLKLQGIAWTDVPKVLIENTKDNKMYILKQGQAIGATNIKVKTILRNKVILTYRDSDFEL